MIRILNLTEQKEIKKLMQDIRVDSYGIKIMLPKAVNYLIRINSVSNIIANILKQEMLSLGGDVSVARGVLTGRVNKTDCLLMGNLAQFKRLNEKLNKQPFGLNRFADDLSTTLTDYQRNNFIWDLGKYKLNLNRRTYLMGIVNLTPDSFSGDGLYVKSPPQRWEGSSRIVAKKIDKIIEYAEKMVEEGADIIDIGGESSRPGARPVSLKEELSRTIPVIKLLSKRINLPISIDTYKPQVAQQALDNGAVIVNDITGLRNPKMAKPIAQYKAGVIIMHMKGNPRIMQNNPKYGNLLNEIIEYLHKAISSAVSYGIDREKIVIDPGIGFGKTLEHNLELLKYLREFKVLGRPILVGPSRKSFIGKLLNAQPQERIFGTVSSCVLAAKNGAKIIRAHDVKAVKQALQVLDAIDK